MPRSSNTLNGFKAQRIFTDRNEPMELARKALALPQSRDEYKIITWYGVGGQGKSRLCTEITNKLLTTIGVAYAALDFDLNDHREVEDAMLVLRSSLGKYGQLRFPLFDLAFARLFIMRHPGKKIRAVHPQLFLEGKSEMLDWLEKFTDFAAVILPGANLLSKYGRMLSRWMGEWWSQRDVKERVAEIDELTSPNQLANMLPQYFANDLYRSMAEEDCPRIVITVDTHEKVRAGENARGTSESLMTDHWLQRLVEESTGVLFFLFGRDKIRWGELDYLQGSPTWEDVLDQHLLGGLSDQDADDFLKKVPIDDEAIRRQIIESSEGLPYCLDLQVDQYANIRNKGETPNVSSFLGARTKILDRFLNHLGEQERREFVLASYPEKLNTDLFGRLAREFLGTAMADWSSLARRSVMSLEDTGALSMHAVMRDELQEQERLKRTKEYLDIHSFLFKYFDGLIHIEDPRRVSKISESALLSAAYHLSLIPAPDYYDWLEKRIDQIIRAARWEVLEQLTNFSVPLFDADSWQMAFLQDALGDALSGRGADSTPSRRQALKIRLQLFGAEDLITATSYTKLAATIGARHPVEAEELHRHSMAIREKELGTKHPDTVMAWANLGIILTRQGRHDDGETFLRKSLKYFQSTNSEHEDVAKAYGALAENLSSQRRFEEAQPLFQRELEMLETVLGTDHPLSMTAMLNFAESLEDCGDAVEAESVLREALARRERVCGTNSVETAQVCFYLAFTVAFDGRYDEAQQLSCRALKIRKDLLGDESDFTVLSIQQLAQLYEIEDRNSEAERLLRDVLDIQQLRFGDYDPRTVAAIHELARNLEKQGRAEDAEDFRRRAIEPGHIPLNMAAANSSGTKLTK